MPEARALLINSGCLTTYHSNSPSLKDLALVASHLVKVRDDLVEEPHALDTALVDAVLRIELGEVGDGSEHDGDPLV